MRETNGTFAAHDGLELFERSWHPDATPRATIAILHGGGEHSGRYGHVAERLTADGFRVDAFDQRSHGHSERVRGIALQCDDAQHLLDDTAPWLRERPADMPLFVIGHSMGGLVAAALATRGELMVAGLVLLGPALRITPAGVMAHAVEIAPTEPDRIVVPMGRSGFDASSRDPVMKALIDADPTHADVTGVPAALLATTSTLGPALRASYAEMDIPLLAMHGTADLMSDPAATAELVDRAGSGDKTLHLVPDGYHALLRDLDREDTLDTIVSWIEERIDSSEHSGDAGPSSSSVAEFLPHARADGRRPLVQRPTGSSLVTTTIEHESRSAETPWTGVQVPLAHHGARAQAGGSFA